MKKKKINEKLIYHVIYHKFHNIYIKNKKNINSLIYKTFIIINKINRNNHRY